MTNEEQFQLRLFRQTLGKHKELLSRQQLRTIKGLAKAGDVTGAYKGLRRILKRKVA